MGVLPRHWPPTVADDAEMIETPAEWPLGSILPLVRRPAAGGGKELGFLLREECGPGLPVTVYLGLILLAKPATCDSLSYESAAQAVGDGWRVD